MNKTIILLLVFIGILVCYLLFVNLRKKRLMRNNKSIEDKKNGEETNNLENTKSDDECCGQHEVCEKESLINTKIIAEYYDDEELDQFIGKSQSEYSEEEIKLFENVFYTLKEFDVAGWLKSLQLRGVELPEKIKEEALLIISERRFK